MFGKRNYYSNKDCDWKHHELQFFAVWEELQGCTVKI